jgi:D-alanyl-D-alanine carboxypeptidase
MSKNKRYLHNLIAALLITTFLFNVTWEVGAIGEVSVSAQAAILMDAGSGRILFEHNSDAQLRIASITKIMTAIIAIELGELSDLVTTSRNAFGVEGSSIYLKLGEKLSLENLLYGLMLRSGNDAAVAIAEHVGGSLEGFVFLMNQKAAELGMEHTVFGNPHGLDTHEEHYSTARDMAVLTAYAMENEVFAEIVGTTRKSAPLEGEVWDRIWHNKNRILTKYPYAEGVKTGYTKRAKRTLVSSASKEGHRLITVTLNGPDDWNDHMNMFEYGFNTYILQTIVNAGQEIVEQGLDSGREHQGGHYEAINSFTYPLAEGEAVSQSIQRYSSVNERRDQSIPYPAGFILFELNGEQIGRIPIRFVTKTFSVQSKQTSLTFWHRVHQYLRWLMGVD